MKKKREKKLPIAAVGRKEYPENLVLILLVILCCDITCVILKRSCILLAKLLG